MALIIQLAWGFTLKGATKIQIINEAVGLMFNCSQGEIESGACVAQSGEQLYVLLVRHYCRLSSHGLGWRSLAGTT
jgi:hypothetical protein